MPGFMRRNAVLISVCACALIMVAFLLVRRSVLHGRRVKAFSQPDTNASVIFAWRYISRLTGKSRAADSGNQAADSGNQDAGGSIEGLALKARFSLHTLSGDERDEVVSYALRLRSELYSSRNFAGRFWMVFVRGV
jgi:hypothetical protein